MAEQRKGASSSNGNGRVSAKDAASRVKEDLVDLLGRNVESVLGIERSDDGGWIVTVAVIELQRIPASTDVLGAYRVAVDDHGDLIGYRRQRRYVRSQADED